MVQVQTDPHQMPIEDATVKWPERLSPYVPVARLRLPARSVPRSSSDMIGSSGRGRRTRRILSDRHADLCHEVRRKPTALRFLKQSFNADTDHQAGLSNLAMSALDLFTASPEGLEGAAAFAEKRPAEFAQHVNWH